MRGMNSQFQQSGGQGFGGRGPRGQEETDEQGVTPVALENADESENSGVLSGESEAGQLSERDQGDSEGEGGSGHKGGKRGEHPEPEDLAQEVVNNDDGSITLSVSSTDSEGETHSRSVTVSDNDTGGIDISSANDEGRSKTVTISADEDGGVDLDIVCINEDGETVSRHVELDMNDDGTVSLEELFTDPDGEEQSIVRDIELAKLLGDESETLNVYEVVEGYLERGHFDLTDVDLTGLNNLDASSVDLFSI